MQDFESKISALKEKEIETQQEINELERQMNFYREKDNREKRKERSHRLITCAAHIEKLLGLEMDLRVAERAARIALAADAAFGREAEPEDVERLVKLGAFVEKIYKGYKFKSESDLKFLNRILIYGDKEYGRRKRESEAKN